MNLEVISKYLIVPSTGQKLTDGTIVMLSRFPGMKWIVHCGWYTYGNQQYQGWYFASIPANTVIPARDEDLMLLTVVSTNTENTTSCGCHPTPPVVPLPTPVPPVPPSPTGGRGLSPQQTYELNRAWISVETIALRDELNRRLLPDGKVVRVNRATEDGKPKYYIWNQVTETWDDFTLGSQGDVPEGCLTKDEADKLYASKSVETNIDNTVTSIAETIIPKMVSVEIENNEELSELRSRIKDLEDSQEWQTLPELKDLS